MAEAFEWNCCGLSLRDRHKKDYNLYEGVKKKTDFLFGFFVLFYI